MNIIKYFFPFLFWFMFWITAIASLFYLEWYADKIDWIYSYLEHASKIEQVNINP